MKTDYWLSYPTDYKKQLKPLLHQQMWLFGQDIIYPHGNLLYRYQFSHTRAAERGSSMYVRQDDAQQVVLWGWGIWFGQVDTGAIFVNRFKAKPQFTSVSILSEAVHREVELPPRTHRVSSMADTQIIRGLWVNLLTWLAEYEAWIVAQAGKKWRQATVRAFQHAVTKPESADTLSSQWQMLAEQGKSLPIKSYTKTEFAR